jgi:hypothetical protein
MFVPSARHKGMTSAINKSMASFFSMALMIESWFTLEQTASAKLSWEHPTFNAQHRTSKAGILKAAEDCRTPRR